MWMLPTNKSLLYALGIGLTLASVYGAGYTHARRLYRADIAQLQQRHAGFNANQGKAMLSRMASVAVDKAQAAHPDIARVALRQMMGNERFKSSLNAAQLAWVLQLLRG